MYSDIVKNEAFLLYCLGHSYDSIVSRLKAFHRKSCDSLNRSTVRNWALSREWEQRRQDEQKRLAQQGQRKASQLMRTSLDKIEVMLPSFLEETEVMEFSSKEGAIYASQYSS